MNLKKSLVPFVFLSMLAGCTGEKGREFYQNRIDRISEIEVILETETKLEGVENPYKKEGNGFVVGNYVLSRDHVTSGYFLNGEDLDRSLVAEETTSLDGQILYPVIERREDDVSIFDLSKTPELCKKYCNDLDFDDLMTEDELYLGMRVYFNASPKGINGFYKESHISKLRPEVYKGTRKEDSFMIQDKIISGTSGKPLCHNGRIVGVAHYGWNEMGGFGVMDNYIDTIKEYENRKNGED